MIHATRSILTNSYSPCPPICSIHPRRFPTGATCCKPRIPSPRPIFGTSTRAAPIGGWPSLSAGATTPIAASSWHMRGPIPQPSLAATAVEVQDKIDTVAGQNNVSDTALQQAILAGNLSQGQLTTALAQMEAMEASAAAAAAYNAEVARREAASRRLGRSCRS